MKWNNYSRYFLNQEFEDDQGKCWMTEDHMDKLYTARMIAGIPFKISSGCRNTAQNKEVGGKPDSEHLTGEGSDIVCVLSRNRHIIINALIYAGFKRIGIGKNFIHAGSSKTLPQNVYWVYD